MPNKTALNKYSPKYPNIKVQLSGEDGNSFSIIGSVSQAMRKAKVDEAIVTEFRNEAMSGDYDNLLRTCMKYVTVL